MGGDMSKIVPGIYVGGLAAAKSQANLTTHNITHLCTVLHQDMDTRLSNRKQIVFHADDSPTEDLSRYFEAACFFIHEARASGGSVLIHCACGVSRSVTITLAYLLVVTEFSLCDLFKAIQGARHCACPNYGFVQQLSKFEKTGVKAVRDKLFCRFGEWPVDKREADKAAITEALNIQNYYILHGEYPDQKSLENALNVGDSSPSISSQGKAVIEDTKPPINRLSPLFYTVYSHGKPRDLSEFLSTRSQPSNDHPNRPEDH